jgi:hypothetical protein
MRALRSVRVHFAALTRPLAALLMLAGLAACGDDAPALSQLDVGEVHVHDTGTPRDTPPGDTPPRPIDAQDAADGVDAPDDGGDAEPPDDAQDTADTDGGGLCPPDIDCDDEDPCTEDRCDPALGCVNEAPAGLCDDGDPCTEDQCDEQGLCQHEPVSGACDDGDACTEGEACVDGACVGEPVDCDDDLDCTIDACDTGSGCLNPLMLGYCLIDGVCVVEGAAEAEHPCWACAPASSLNAWTSLDAQPCDDGEICTSGDVCVAGTCLGQAYACDDGLDCTLDACDGAGGCVATPAGGACLIDGVCVAKGETAPSESCLSCDPTQSALTWSSREAGALCDDGDPCTSVDLCIEDICTGTAEADCDDGLDCTVDGCHPATDCTHEILPGRCLIQGACHTIGSSPADNPCRVCFPDLSTETWTPVQEGVACDDGDACSADDACVQGNCLGDVVNCDDGLSCTTDACDQQAGCQHTLMEQMCAIDGACYAESEEHPDNPCKLCKPELKTTAWSSRTFGVTCDDGDPCTVGDVCQSGLCKGVPSPDCE